MKSSIIAGFFVSSFLMAAPLGAQETVTFDSIVRVNQGVSPAGTGRFFVEGTVAGVSPFTVFVGSDAASNQNHAGPIAFCSQAGQQVQDKIGQYRLQITHIGGNTGTAGLVEIDLTEGDFFSCSLVKIKR